jgi:hypothetical protein
MRVTALGYTLMVASAAVVAQEIDVGTVVARATQYVADYEKRFSVLVAQEEYVQEIRWQSVSSGGNLTRANPGGGFNNTDAVQKRQVLRSDFLLVALEGGWMPFRDVFEVNGRYVHESEDRLARLFTQPSSTSFAQAAEIMRESTKYNIGSVTRTINIPTLALLFLHPDIVKRFEFRREAEEAVADRRAWVVSYRETVRPSLIKTSRGRDLPLSGKLWIEPQTGTVLKTFLEAADPEVRAQVTVTMKQDEDIDLWVPAVMDEYYKDTRESRDILGRATYDLYRRFHVNTDEVIRKPPQP